MKNIRNTSAVPSEQHIVYSNVFPNSIIKIYLTDQTLIYLIHFNRAILISSVYIDKEKQCKCRLDEREGKRERVERDGTKIQKDMYTGTASKLSPQDTLVRWALLPGSPAPPWRGRSSARRSGRHLQSPPNPEIINFISDNFQIILNKLSTIGTNHRVTIQ